MINKTVDIKVNGLFDGPVEVCECNEKSCVGIPLGTDMDDRTQLYVFDAEEQKEKTFEELVAECEYSCKKGCGDPEFGCILKTLNAAGLLKTNN